MVIRVACFEDIVWMELSQDRVRIWKLFAVVKFVIRLLTFFSVSTLHALGNAKVN